MRQVDAATEAGCTQGYLSQIEQGRRKPSQYLLARLARTYAVPLELVRAALHSRGSLYAGVLDALCEALPEPTARQLQEARRLAEEGPPAELVGLAPFERSGSHRFPPSPIDLPQSPEVVVSL